MFESGLEHVFQSRGLQRDFASDHAGARRLGQRAGVEHGLVVTVRRRRRVTLVARGRRYLAAGHAVDFVVQHHASDVEIAPAGVDQMIAADRKTVAVAGNHDHFEVRPRELQAGGEGQRTAVGDVERIGIDIVAEPARAANARDENQPVLVDFEFVDRPQQRAQRDAVTAARAQEMREQVFAQVIVDIELSISAHVRPAPRWNPEFAAA